MGMELFTRREVYTRPDRHVPADDTAGAWPQWLHQGSACIVEGCPGRRWVYRPQGDPTGLDTADDYRACGQEPTPDLLAGGWICDGPEPHEGWIPLGEVITCPQEALATAGPLGALMNRGGEATPQPGTALPVTKPEKRRSASCEEVKG